MDRAFRGPVAIVFAEEAIGQHFAELLDSMGVAARTCPKSIELKTIPASTRIVTEAVFFPELSPLQRRQCLLVGPSSSLDGLPALKLTQPLTEEKIESALAAFLKS